MSHLIGLIAFSERIGLIEGAIPLKDLSKRGEMEREFEENLRDIEDKVPKDLIREYVSENGAKVRYIGPLVNGSTTTIGDDGKPVVRVFGNIQPSMRAGSFSKPRILSERQPLSEVSTTVKEVKVAIELPGVSKEQIKINVEGSQLDIKTKTQKEGTAKLSNYQLK